MIGMMRANFDLRGAARTVLLTGMTFAVIISWINVEVGIFNTTANLMTIPVKLFNYIQYSVDPMIAAVSATTIYVAVAAVVLLDRAVGIDRITTSRGRGSLACAREPSSTRSIPIRVASPPA